MTTILTSDWLQLLPVRVRAVLPRQHPRRAGQPAHLHPGARQGGGQVGHLRPSPGGTYLRLQRNFTKVSQYCLHCVSTLAMVFTELFSSGPHPLQQVRGQQADPLHPPREECSVLEAGAAEVEHNTQPQPHPLQPR